MKLNFLKSIYILGFVLSTIIVSCVDDFPYRNEEIPEGEGTLIARATFTPMVANSINDTRTDGDKLNAIESLCVLVYDTQKNLVKKYSSSDNELDAYKVVKVDVDKDEDYDKSTDGGYTDESETAQAQFNLKDLAYGQYYIYAVANMGNLAKYEEEIKTVEGLKNIQLKWNENDIIENAQMFGYFTTENNVSSEGFEAPPITFSNTTENSKIHAWLKRAASKVTVAFDPSGLNQGVKIYIRSVTIRDIPKTCLLGAENTPSSVEGENGLLNHVNTPFPKPDYQNPTAAISNTRLEYDSKGVITDGGKTGGNITDGLKLDNSIRKAIPEKAHAVDAPSLFFYENNQNKYLLDKDPNYKGKSIYNKHQQSSNDQNGDGVGTPVRDDTIEIDGEKKESDLKDKVPNGTYIEVDAYYISDNPAKIGAGSIKYRFMLGKDASFDYDAQRNHHFKITLGFKGWANEPDWHIDYELPNPGIEVPPTFRVSYLYLQKSELPIRIIGDVEYVTVEITENNWNPYSPTPNADGYYVPAAHIDDTTPEVYQFKWNYEAYKNSEYLETVEIDYGNDQKKTVKRQKPAFGFLTLHLPPNQGTTVLPELTFSKDANKKLIEYYNEYEEGIRRFYPEDLEFGDDKLSSQDKHPSPEDKYSVKKVLNDAGEEIEGQRTLMLPVWTRTKTLIPNSGFSGNNPYEAFERKAVIHIVAQYKKIGDVTPRRGKDVEVYQVKRIVNPKGVWRAHDRTEPFNVTLLEADNSNAESNFHAFKSEGEWTAYIESSTNDAGFSLRPNGKTNGYMENGVIHGYTNSSIDFAINFGASVKEDESECAVVTVKYHGNQCVHKILIRKGYNAPLRMGNNKLWSSFSLYQATNTGRTEDGRTVYDAVLTKNPLMLGSMFRRGKQNQGIFVWNNMQKDLAVFTPPYGASFVVGEDNNASITNPKDSTQFKAKWKSMTWDEIGYDDATSDEGKNSNLGIYYAKDENGLTRKYRVPTYSEFQALTNNSEFGFGVFYGSQATEPKLVADEAYGLIAPYNEESFDDPKGMRAVVAYDKKTGNQILFPIGRYGVGTRRMFNVPKLPGTRDGNPIYFGILHYSDVYAPLTGTNDLYRPIPYNLSIVSGCIYWIDQYYATKNGCLGWDMNYFNFDFNDYTANNYRDACPIKFVIDED